MQLSLIRNLTFGKILPDSSENKKESNNQLSEFMLRVVKLHQHAPE